MKQNTIRPMLFKYWVVCLLLFILFIQARASSFMPAVTNYLAKDYEAGYQNWACAQGSNGEMYFGNSQGLLVYDGYRWTLHKSAGEPYCPFGVCERRPYLCGGIRGIRLFQVFGGRHSPVPFFEQIPEKISPWRTTRYGTL